MMTIGQALFAGSSTRLEDRPAARLPEFAFIGRSNVGKSSLINMLCRTRNLAHTSANPGKTLCINHFLINGSWYLVDLPGYGFARISKEGRARLGAMIRRYVCGSPEMQTLFVLLDSRLELQKIDLEFMQLLGEEGIPFAMVYTKCDKVGKNTLQEHIAGNNEKLLAWWEELPPLFVTSSRTGEGRDALLGYIGEILEAERGRNSLPVSMET